MYRVTAELTQVRVHSGIAETRRNGRTQANRSPLVGADGLAEDFSHLLLSGAAMRSRPALECALHVVIKLTYQ